MKDFMPLITAALLLVTISLIVLTREGSKNIDWHNVPADGEDISNYGIDISWPIQGKVSTNYPWLPHNVDPIINPTPIQYQEMPLQPFGNDGRHQAYMKHLEGCRSFYTNKEDSGMCDVYDFDRMLMNKRQPQSMQVSNRDLLGLSRPIVLVVSFIAVLPRVSIGRIIQKLALKRFLHRQGSRR